MPEQRVERRLAAILAGDVVGYSRLMGADEEGTLTRLNAHRREFLEPKIAEYRGRVVKRTGDGILIEFPSAVDAAHCATEIQKGMSERNHTVSPDKRIEFRIGIHVGDIIIEEGDIFGDGVNVAARLEGIADPGGICISDDTFRQLRDKVNVVFEDAGEQQLKNIERPLRVYRIQLGKTVQKASAPSKRPSIAVLPFQNMSGDPEQEYFADGMVDEIITGLSRIKWLLVTSRNSSFIYKNKPASVKEIAEKLGVRYVLEGGVRKSGSRVRITVQLIDATNDTHLWAEQYDRLLDDVFALQDEITMRVVAAIEPSVRKAEIERVRRQRPENLDAYDLVLRAMPLVFTRMPREAALAVPLLQDALRLEPNYSSAHAFLSWCLHARYIRGDMQQDDKMAAIRHAHAAISSGNDDATTLAVAAFIIALDEHDLDTSLRLFDRALEISNSNIIALSCSATTLALLGKFEIAVERAQRAVQLSPFDPFNFRSNQALAMAYLCTDRYSEAADAAKSIIDVNPEYSYAYAFLAAALWRLGRAEEAKATVRDVLKHQSTFTIKIFTDNFGYNLQAIKPMIDAWREVGIPG
jgi:TolB-like protein/class 3 adenylate cyclase